MAGSRGDHGYDGYGMLWLVSSKEKFTTQPWAAKLRDGPGLMALGAQTAWGLGSRCGSLKTKVADPKKACPLRTYLQFG